MIKTKKQQTTQSKSNLLDLFRKRIQTRSNKNTPIHPSCLKPTLVPSNLSTNHPKQRRTPSKTSVFTLEEPSELSVNWEGYLNSSKQLLSCNIHNNKQAKFVRENTEEYYCEKCAIMFTNEGHRLTQIDSMTQIKKTLELVMNKQIDSIRATYTKLIDLVNKQMQKEVQRIGKYFKQLSVQETSKKIQIPTFVPSCDIQKIIQKVKTSIGKITLKKINLEPSKITNESYLYKEKEKESHRLSNRRHSEKSNSKKPPAQIMINLYINDEDILRQLNKENREVNMLL